jgi:hypothetical protein
MRKARGQIQSYYSTICLSRDEEVTNGERPEKLKDNG